MSDNHEEMRVCTKCHEAKPVSEFYIKDKHTGRRMSRCKACFNAQTLARYHANKVLKPVEPEPTEKVCTQCGQLKPVTEFNWKHQATGKRKSACRACTRTQVGEYNAAHREQRLAKGREYYAANRAAILARQKAWYESNPDQVRAIHHKYKTNNRDTVNAATHRRRSTIASADGSYTAAEWRDLKAHYGHHCLMCGRQEPAIRLTVDHVIPPALGGTNRIDNIQPLCKSCNSKKHRGIVDLRPLWAQQRE